MGRLGDCEQIVSGFAGQPVNTYSSLIYVIAGLVVAARSGPNRLALLLSSGLVGVGVGSILFHGPGGTVAEALHAVSIAALLAAVLTSEVIQRGFGLARRLLPGLAVVVAIPGFWRAAEMPVQLLLIVLIFGTVAVPLRQSKEEPGRPLSNELAGPVLLLAAALLIFAVSRTSGPWCEPASVVQGHAAWHALSAAAVAWYALRRTDGPVRSAQ